MENSLMGLVEERFESISKRFLDIYSDGRYFSLMKDMAAYLAAGMKEDAKQNQQENTDDA